MRFILPCCILLFLTSLARAEEIAGITADEQAIIEQTNAQRRQAGAPELSQNALLCRVARQHAQAMAKANNLSHRLNGKSIDGRVSAAGYKWTAVSENIAWNQRSVPDVMDCWMRSDGHRINLLNKDVTEMGAGIAMNSKGEFFFVQVFASPAALTRFDTYNFTVKNGTDRGMSVDVRVGKLFSLKPGESAQYKLVTPDAAPTIALQSSGQALEIKVQNGAQYTLGKRDGRLELMRGE